MLISEDKLEKILVGGGYIQKVDFDMAKTLSQKENISLDKILVEKGLIQDEVLGKLVAEAGGYRFAKLKKAHIDDISPKLLRYIPKTTAFAQQAIVFSEEGGVLKVATTNPSNHNFFKMLERKHGKRVEAFYVTDFDLDQALRRYRGNITTEIDALVEEFQKDPQTGEECIVQLVNLILDYGYTTLSSDIHIEPLTTNTIIRYRQEGVLQQAIQLPKELHTRVCSRIKILSRLRTDEKEAAQDGRFSYKVRGIEIDFRVSIMPTTEGENVVMRIIMQRGRRFELQDLGLSDADMKKVKKNAHKPYGLIVSAGPTGSGKTTSLYALLQLINYPEVNIMTIEDPVEYEIERVRQVQVNPAKEITFPKGLRSIVRQDPDVIMIGEIRDKETGDIAVNSAMTGHLVLSTVHANDAATVFSRFFEMGAKPHLVSASINAAIAQRLTRKICDECKESYPLSEEEKEILHEEPILADTIKRISGIGDINKLRLHRGKGCKFCKDTGYTTRTAIFEVLEATEEIREMIAKNQPVDTIRNKAIEQGMTTMLEDGIKKLLAGSITFEELRRATKT